MNFLTSKKLITVIVSSALLSACGGSSGGGASENTNPDVPDVELPKYNIDHLDGTDGSQVAQLDLVSGSTVEDDTWHIAYQKYLGFKLNGGISAGGNVSGCVAHEYQDLFDAKGNPVVDKFKALTASTTLSDFNKVGTGACTDFAFDS